MGGKLKELLENSDQNIKPQTVLEEIRIKINLHGTQQISSTC